MAKPSWGKMLTLLNYIKYGLALAALVVIINVGLAGDAAGVAMAVMTQGSGCGISTYPESGFLKAPNMAPGDRVSADLTVKNDGNCGFMYDISAVPENGRELFDVLDLEIRKDNCFLYKGKLKDLQQKVLGFLSQQGVNVLNFSVYFPAECNDLYQGKSTSVTFLLTARQSCR